MLPFTKCIAAALHNRRPWSLQDSHHFVQSNRVLLQPVRNSAAMESGAPYPSVMIFPDAEKVVCMDWYYGTWSTGHSGAPIEPAARKQTTCGSRVSISCWSRTYTITGAGTTISRWVDVRSRVPWDLPSAHAYAKKHFLGESCSARIAFMELESLKKRRLRKATRDSTNPTRVLPVVPVIEWGSRPIPKCPETNSGCEQGRRTIAMDLESPGYFLCSECFVNHRTDAQLWTT